MRLIVGLGNPGVKYKHSRHNIGYRVVDSLAKDNNIKLKSNLRVKARVSKAKICDEKVTLFKSLRFMNICGLSVSSFMLAEDIDKDSLLVICDCLDLTFGKIRFKNKGRDAGHRGMRSIINSLGRDDFSRIKIGIGRCKDTRVEISEYVLSKFDPEEENKVPQIIEAVKEKIYAWIKKGVN